MYKEYSNSWENCNLEENFIFTTNIKKNLTTKRIQKKENLLNDILDLEKNKYLIKTNIAPT